jgi:hypothetical protein
LILAIDPSINHIGCCIVDPKGNYVTGTTFKTKGKQSTEKLQYLSTEWPRWLVEHKEGLDVIVIEHTRFFARQNNQSHASAQKLNLAKGVLFGLCRAHAAMPCHLVWIPGFNKAQATLLSRAYRCPSAMSQHEVDAFWLANQWANATPQLKKQWISAELDG